MCVFKYVAATGLPRNYAITQLYALGYACERPQTCACSCTRTRVAHLGGADTETSRDSPAATLYSSLSFCCMYCLRLSTRNLRPHSLLTCRPLSRLSRYTAAEESCCQGRWGCQGQEGPGHPRQGGEGRLNSLSTLRAIHIFTRPAVYSHDNRSHLALSGGVFHRPPRTSLVPLPHALCQHLSPSPVTPSPSHPSPATSVLSEYLRSHKSPPKLFTAGCAGCTLLASLVLSNRWSSLSSLPLIFRHPFPSSPSPPLADSSKHMSFTNVMVG